MRAENNLRIKIEKSRDSSDLFFLVRMGAQAASVGIRYGVSIRRIARLFRRAMLAAGQMTEGYFSILL